jgi:hypothetical protein
MSATNKQTPKSTMDAKLEITNNYLCRLVNTTMPFSKYDVAKIRRNGVITFATNNSTVVFLVA